MFDQPWKNLTELFFQEFTEFFWPAAYQNIDWNASATPLSTELPPQASGDKVGTRIADKLFRVQLKDGEQCLILVHLEFQNQFDTTFPKRMAVYNFRLFLKYDCEVVSMAILGDSRPSWRPNSFIRKRWDFKNRVDFPIVKLADFRTIHAAKLKEKNLFATAVDAHLEAMKTCKNSNVLVETKLALIRRLADRNYDSRRLIALFRFIDTMMDLPRDLDQRFRDRLRKETGGRHMNAEEWFYSETAIQKTLRLLAGREGFAKGLSEGRQAGIQEGRQAGIQEGRELGQREGFQQALIQLLTEKYRELPSHITQRIQDAGPEQLLNWITHVNQTQSLVALFDH
ncbi:hypothetical protein [Acanthopleuribacter pedis]|uniref:DUF4351 domain-containing protein n=1 Tax=Acanthopleuribacter pedis TaxID=442870 RepID=A0A8J7Q176_9BACT|nr:hypothetical protein [Acanthopleuribacter pedis]MBO1317340.1 hypothetical protein [Acanthopleuribacter pedis]MBO1318647.1 hypothetical protein [Acanthopleuribacter pedis]